MDAGARYERLAMGVSQARASGVNKLLVALAGRLPL
jgi:hypothetical protein